MSVPEKKESSKIASHNEMDIAIVGSGLAGLSAAISAKRTASDKSVCIFEKNSRSGKKFLLSGNGQCNITHAGDIATFFIHYGSHGRFVQPALMEYPNSALIELLVKEGIDLEELDNGKIFPVSRKGADILTCFERFCKEAGVQLIPNTKVDDVRILPENRFEIVCGSVRYRAKKIVLSTGGLSMPRTGSTGDGFHWAKNMGHQVTQLHPALTPVFVENWQYADCSGVSVSSRRIVLMRDEKKILECDGDLLVTHEGLSGPAIMNISRSIRSGDRIELTVVPFVNADDFDAALLEKIKISPMKDISSIVRDFGVPSRLVRAILRENEIPGECNACNLDRTTRKRIASLMTAWPCPVRSPGGFDRAMVTAGGIELSQVDRKTMESRIVPGLYFAGEVLDIDGDSGGFNLQFAWSSGMLAGRNAAS